MEMNTEELIIKWFEENAAFEGLTQSEIASAIHKKPGNVRSAMSKLRKKDLICPIGFVCNGEDVHLKYHLTENWFMGEVSIEQGIPTSYTTIRKFCQMPEFKEFCEDHHKNLEGELRKCIRYEEVLPKICKDKGRLYLTYPIDILRHVFGNSRYIYFIATGSRLELVEYHLNYPKASTNEYKQDNKIRKILASNLEKPFSIRDIKNESGYSDEQIYSSLERLMKGYFLKTVGIFKDENSQLQEQFQINESPLKGLSIERKREDKVISESSTLDETIKSRQPQGIPLLAKMKQYLNKGPKLDSEFIQF